MATRTVRHAFITWPIVEDRRGNPTVVNSITVFRGYEVDDADIPKEYLEKFEDAGAFGTDTDPVIPVGVVTYPDAGATEEQLIAFVISATPEERDAFTAAHPELATATTEALKHLRDARDALVPEPAPPVVPESDGTPPYDAIVTGTTSDVAAYIRDHPDEADRVLDAETARAAAEGKSPRSGIVAAARVAAGFTPS